MRGKERFSVPKRVRPWIKRFSAGPDRPGLKPVAENESLSRGLKSSFPLLKQGAPTGSASLLLGHLRVGFFRRRGRRGHFVDFDCPVAQDRQVLSIFRECEVLAVGQNR